MQCHSSSLQTKKKDEKKKKIVVEVITDATFEMHFMHSKTSKVLSGGTYSYTLFHEWNELLSKIIYNERKT